MIPSIHTVLLVDDNPDDCEIIKEAWDEIPVGRELRLVHDGTDLLDYLYRRESFSSRESSPRPSLILLDLNMPRMSGEEALAEIKKDSRLATIPIVVLTTSKASRDIEQTAGRRVNGYIQKPNSFQGYLQMFINLKKNWPEILEQHSSGRGGNGAANIAWC